MSLSDCCAIDRMDPFSNWLYTICGQFVSLLIDLQCCKGFMLIVDESRNQFTQYTEAIRLKGHWNVLQKCTNDEIVKENFVIINENIMEKWLDNLMLNEFIVDVTPNNPFDYFHLIELNASTIHQLSARHSLIKIDRTSNIIHVENLKERNPHLSLKGGEVIGILQVQYRLNKENGEYNQQFVQMQKETMTTHDLIRVNSDEQINGQFLNKIKKQLIKFQFTEHEMFWNSFLNSLHVNKEIFNF
ncbi:hypothetical protein SNEBB_011285 [Seison nebaliae]|nr:hypothetical protein SNEBB_011285 [Seison nebaliae]